jgi:hypothetical protein
MKKWEEILLRLEKLEELTRIQEEDIESLKEFRGAFISFVIGMILVGLFFLK